MNDPRHDKPARPSTRTDTAPEVLVPDQPPQLNPAAARALYQILLRAYRSTLPPTP